MSWFSYSPLTPRDGCLTPRSRVFIYLGLAVTLLLLSYQMILNQSPTMIATGKTIEDSIADDDPFAPDPVRPAEKELVFAAMEASNMSWVEEHLPDWRTNIYRADAKGQDALTVPINKGNEAMVYLTYIYASVSLNDSADSVPRYIIDRYWSLPDVSVFLHGGRYQWHVDNPLYDSVISISDLQSDFVQEAGYVSLRCAWSVGCPRELEPARYLRERPDDSHHPAAMEYPDRFMELFPRAEVPEAVGAPCCSQFALSKNKIREQSLDYYIRLQRWLMDTELNSGISGRIFEYSWHSGSVALALAIFFADFYIVIFGKPAQHCLDQRECYCRTYGYCNMTDTEIQNNWVWRGLTLPEGWPEPKESNESPAQ